MHHLDGTFIHVLSCLSLSIVTRLSDEDCQTLYAKLEEYFEEQLHPLFLSSHSLTTKQAASITGYFLMIIAIKCASRAGEHINLEVEWVLSAQQEKTTGNYVIKVSYSIKNWIVSGMKTMGCSAFLSKRARKAMHEESRHLLFQGLLLYSNRVIFSDGGCIKSDHAQSRIHLVYNISLPCWTPCSELPFRSHYDKGVGIFILWFKG